MKFVQKDAVKQEEKPTKRAIKEEKPAKGAVKEEEKPMKRAVQEADVKSS